MITLPQQIKEYKSINIIARHPNWDAATTYQFSQAEGDVNTVFYDHYYYRSVVDDNVGNIPTENSDKWLKWSISDRYAQIDLRASTATVWDATRATTPADHALISEFDNNVYDAIALGNVYGETVKIQVFDSNDQEVQSYTKSIYNRPQSNTWYNYYFDQFVSTATADSFFFRIQPLASGYIRVTVEANSVTDTASVGYMVAGVTGYAGCTLYGVQLGLNDNSLVETDDFGVTQVTKRIANETMDIDVIFPKETIMDKMRNARKVFGEIILFIGDETDTSEYEHLMILGYVQDYNTILEDQEQVTASWSLIEVI